LFLGQKYSFKNSKIKTFFTKKCMLGDDKISSLHYSYFINKDWLYFSFQIQEAGLGLLSNVSAGASRQVGAYGFTY